jgi:hypothetical protein
MDRSRFLDDSALARELRRREGAEARAVAVGTGDVEESEAEVEAALGAAGVPDVASP